MSRFTMVRDINGYNSFGLEKPRDKTIVYQTTLASGVAQTITLPSKSAHYIVYVVPEPGSNVWVAYNTAATIPTGSMATTSSELNPIAREADAGDVVYLLTDESSVQVGVRIDAV